MICCNKDFEPIPSYKDLCEENIRLGKQLKHMNEKLIEVNDELKKEKEENDQAWARKIDKFVDEWFEENKEEVDIGVINLGFFKIDIFPDYLEKYIYKKMFKIAYSFVTTHR
tara:strand:- start:195 stop:530 length:336 start_codon:yes stop_codon:yes gene_type:complete